MTPDYQHVLIFGAGPGLSASFARKCAEEGLRVSLAARSPDDLAALCAETGSAAHKADAADRSSVAALFAALDGDGAPDVVLYNPSARERGPFVDIDPDAAARAVHVTALGGFVVAQEAARRMVPNRHGALLFTGATASVKAVAQSATFAMGKFALRGLAQSLARELHPQGVHIGHFVIDGGIANPGRAGRAPDPDNPDAMLDPDAIARVYWSHLRQDRSAWSWEQEIRPWVESF